MQNLLFGLLILCIPSAFLQGQLFNPSVSLNGCYTINGFQKDIASGIFSLSHRKFNLGFEAANEFGLRNDHFLSAGIRYQSFNTTVTALNQIAELHDKPDPFVWTKEFNSLTVPLLFGKNFYTKNDRVGKIYFGVSAGILTNSMATNTVTKSIAKNVNTQDTFKLASTDTIGLLKPQFLASIELGGSYQPFKKVPKLLLGFRASYQLNRANVGSYSGLAENVSQGMTYPYQGTFAQRSLHLGISLQYYFKKREKLKASLESAI